MPAKENNIGLEQWIIADVIRCYLDELGHSLSEGSGVDFPATLFKLASYLQENKLPRPEVYGAMVNYGLLALPTQERVNKYRNRFFKLMPVSLDSAIEPVRKILIDERIIIKASVMKAVDKYRISKDVAAVQLMCKSIASQKLVFEYICNLLDRFPEVEKYRIEQANKRSAIEAEAALLTTSVGPRLSVKLQPPSVIIDGDLIAITGDQAIALNALIQAQGDYVKLRGHGISKPGGLQFLIRGLEFLVHRHDFFVRPFEFLVCALELLNGALQVITRGLQLAFKLVQQIRLFRLSACCLIRR